MSSIKSVALIGAGNMARSIIQGLSAEHAPALLLSVSARRAEQRAKLAADFNIGVFADNAECATGVDAVVLCVKPQAIPAVCREIAPALTSNMLLISIAAGVPMAAIDRWLSDAGAILRPIVRCMPNTPAAIGWGMTGLVANSHTSLGQRRMAERIMAAVGATQWLDDESLLDAVTAVSGSGPAYVYLLMEAMIEAGKKLGLAPDVASALTLQTVMGAVQMARSTKLPLAELRRQVTSPGGTTQAAVEVLQTGRFEELFERALFAAARRSAQLATSPAT